MSETTPVKHPSESQDAVILKPLGTLKPGAWLAILYSLILMLLLVTLLVVPGLVRQGSLVGFDSDPAGCAVRVDDIYAGITPCKVFVRKGHHIVTFASPGFTSDSREVDIPNRVCGSLFFPKKLSLAAKLTSPSPSGALVHALGEYAFWSKAGNPTADYQIPMVLSDAVTRLSRGDTTASFRSILASGARYATTASTLRDLARSVILNRSSALASSPMTALASSREILRYLSESPYSSLWLSTALPPGDRDPVVSSDWYKNAAHTSSSLSEQMRAQRPAGMTGRSIQVAGIRFVELRPAPWVTGNPSRTVPLESYWVAATETSISDYARFTGAVTDWAPAKAPLLTSQGVATEDYCAPCTDTAFPAPSRSGVSWYAANAYCSWLGSLLPAELSGWEIRLPTEIEWERAASESSLQHMAGGLWEWCHEDFAPFDYLPANGIVLETIPGPDHPVRGGSWATLQKQAGITTRAALPPQSCSDFVGFRPVIARKNNPEAAY